MSENEEIENKVWQQTRLIEYLNSIPIIQLVLEDVEADDIISYTVQHSSLKGWQKVIVSSDKDFFQLCDELNISKERQDLTVRFFQHISYPF
jgi:5'-3' exonuclease